MSTALLNEKRPLLARPEATSQNKPNKSQKFTLVIHGGAGTMARERSTPEQRAGYKAALAQALKAGYDVLERGGEAMDAAVAAVSSMEDCPLFNSAKGAVFNVDGKNELEASIMLSTPPQTHPHVPASRRGTSATLLTRARNPSQLVRALYLAPEELEPHPFLSGTNAEDIAHTRGAVLVDPSYFYTRARWLEHRRGLGLPDDDHEGGNGDKEPEQPLDLVPRGTVGAVALDERGAICAVTSTGGRTNKLVGRIGDTPHMGAGFWAEQWSLGGVHAVWAKVCGKDAVKGVGVSGTGDGDYFIRQNTAATVAHRVRFLHEPLDKATSHVVQELLKDGGLGGVIALDREGNVSMPLNCSGMYRGVIRPDGVAKTAIFADDDLEPTDY